MNITTRSLFAAVTLAALLGLNAQAQAQTVFFDDFNSGSSKGMASTYFSDASQNNGLVVKSENLYTTSGIGADVEGSGFFLFEGTNGSNTPAGQNALYISPSFAVTQNTLYNVSFFLTNDNPGNVAQIQADINGSALGAAVSAAGTYASNGWQQFNFTFNSGTATSAALTLSDLQTSGGGNDFGVDNIQVAAVPEPGSVAFLAGIIITGAGFARKRRRK